MKTCPFCGTFPNYSKITVCQNHDDNKNIWEVMRNLPAEVIACKNVNCKVRPRLQRVNTDDAERIWDERPS